MSKTNVVLDPKFKNTIKEAIENFFNKKTHELAYLKNTDTSYNIGGRISASSSGNIIFEKNYYEDGGYYGVKRTWDGVLKIGTNIKVIDGKSALDYAKNISTELRVELESFFAGTENNYIVDDEDNKVIHIEYDYHSNYCVVKYRFLV